MDTAELIRALAPGYEECAPEEAAYTDHLGAAYVGLVRFRGHGGPGEWKFSPTMGGNHPHYDYVFLRKVK